MKFLRTFIMLAVPLSALLFAPLATHADVQTCESEEGTCTTGGCGVGFTEIPVNGLCPEDENAVCCKASGSTKESCESKGNTCKETCEVGESGVPSLACPAGLHCCQGNAGAKEQIEANIKKSKGSSIVLENPLGAGATIYTVIERVISAFLGMVGAFALLVFVWAGVTWMTAGSSDRVQKAQDMMKYAVLGLAMIAFAYAITNFFIKAFIGTGGAPKEEAPIEYALPPEPNP